MKEQPICGIIMPISHVDDQHTESHWQKVQKILETSILAADLRPQPVWLNSSFDVIQAKILKNLFENDFAVCDISTRNPNVMLELGMRLTTKKPTIIVAEQNTRLPFDTNVISTEFYNPSLEYGDTVDFIARVSKLLIETCAAISAGSYHAYLQHFRFETIEPETISVSANEVIERRLDDLVSLVSDLKARSDNHGVPSPRSIMGKTTYSSTGQGLSSNPVDIFDPASALGERTRYENREDDLQRLNDSIKVNPDLTVGQRVNHAKFGNGTVALVEGPKVEVDFDNAGKKRVLHVFVSILDT